jgi:hypothetical protein
MKKILIATAILAGFTFAAGPKPEAAKLDSLRKARIVVVDSIIAVDRAKDSTLFADLRKAVPDSLKGKLDTAAKGWKIGAGKHDSAKVDSLKKVYVGKRDSLISKIKDTVTADKIKARIAVLEADRALLKARLDARKAEIDAKIADLKKKFGK